jgi:hypothetical protein
VRAVGAAAALVLSLLAAACGGSEPTAADWADAANTACAEALLAVESQTISPGLEGTEHSITELLGIMRDLIAKLDAIDAPTEIEPRTQELVGLYRKSVTALENELSAYQRGELLEAAGQSASLDPIALRADRLALDLGAGDCAREPGDLQGDADIADGEPPGA